MQSQLVKGPSLSPESLSSSAKMQGHHIIMVMYRGRSYTWEWLICLRSCWKWQQSCTLVTSALSSNRYHTPEEAACTVWSLRTKQFCFFTTAKQLQNQFSLVPSWSVWEVLLRLSLEPAISSEQSPPAITSLQTHESCSQRGSTGRLAAGLLQEASIHCKGFIKPFDSVAKERCPSIFSLQVERLSHSSWLLPVPAACWHSPLASQAFWHSRHFWQWS